MKLLAMSPPSKFDWGRLGFRGFAVAAGLLLMQQSFLCAQTAPERAAVGGKYTISGAVVSATTGQPLEDAEVSVQTVGPGGPMAETTTDAEGRFVFEGLPAAKYLLSASRHGFIAAAFDDHDGFSTGIVTGKGLVSGGLIFPLLPQAMIGGTVTDDSGDPVQHAQVSLYRRGTRDAPGEIVRHGMTMTDDLGIYEFERLEPGDYYVAVSATPWYATQPQPTRDARGNTIAEATRSPLDVAYPMTFFDGVTDSDSATPIRLKGGDKAKADFVLYPLPAVHLSVRVPTIRQGERIYGPTIRQRAFGGIDIIPSQQVGEMYNGGQRVWTFGGLAPGHYEIQFRGPDGTVSSMPNVDATSPDGMVMDASQAVRLADVTGQVALADGEKLPNRVAIILQSLKGTSRDGASVNGDGSFTLHGVAPGTYEVLATTPGGPLAVVQMIASGAAVHGRMLTVGAPPVTLAAILAEGSSTVTGFAERGGRPAPGVLVLLVPRNPAAASERFRRDQSDSDGSFALNEVIPGEYTLVAIEDGWTLDWARPEAIAPYLAKGRQLTVSPREKGIALDGAIEVQPR